MPNAPEPMIYPVSSLPGVKRDGTPLDGNYYSDGQWCRFRNGRPKKMGGYQTIAHVDDGAGGALNYNIRSIFPYYAGSGLYIVYNFHGQGITGVVVDPNAVGGSQFSRTPAGWTNSDTCWQVDSLYDVTGTPDTMLLAHAADNIMDIANDVNYPVYYGIASDQTTPLVTTGQSVSGGIVVLQPVLVLYGSNGLLKNSDANKVTTYSGGVANEANVSGTKIVKGLPLRGGSTTPAGLFWSIDALIRMSFVGGTVLWQYDTLSEESSILSSNGVIEYDGVFYWAGIDRFLMYNGVLKEVPNPLNQDFFFDNLNWAYRQKVWVTKLPRWGEIWWFFPKGNSTECNWAVVYNVRENTWYDTPVKRSAGYPPRELRFPIWSGWEPDVSLGHDARNIIKHEFGTNAINDDEEDAIHSYFETSNMGFAVGGISVDAAQNPNRLTRIVKVEPDFKQVGVMSCEVSGEPFAQSATDETINSDPIYFNPTMPFPTPPGGVAPTQAVLDFGAQRRIFRLRFTSNVQDGDYHAGKILMHLENGDEHA